MRVTQAGRDAGLQGYALALAGGRVCLYGATPDELLAELLISNMTVSEGWLRFVLRAEGLRLGAVQSFAAVGSDGVAILEGTAGRTDGDLVLPLDTIQPGSPITISAAFRIPEAVEAV